MNGSAGFRGFVQTLALTVLLSAGLVGCAGIARDAGSQPDPRQQVRELATARWDAMIAGDLAKAYEYLSPGTRDVMSLDLYKKKTHTGAWKKAQVESVKCEEDRCTVEILVEYSFRDMKSIKTILDEIWLREGGKWWYAPRK